MGNIAAYKVNTEQVESIDVESDERIVSAEMAFWDGQFDRKPTFGRLYNKVTCWIAPLGVASTSYANDSLSWIGIRGLSSNGTENPAKK